MTVIQITVPLVGSSTDADPLRPLDVEELLAIAGMKMNDGLPKSGATSEPIPNSSISSRVVSLDPDAGTCVIELETERDDWLVAMQTAVAGKTAAQLRSAVGRGFPVISEKIRKNWTKS